MSKEERGSGDFHSITKKKAHRKFTKLETSIPEDGREIPIQRSHRTTNLNSRKKGRLSSETVALITFITVSAFKWMLLPFYFSTDFEVHRNWLAITQSLPLDKWYVDATSEWTLDYPPFFAWLEYLLSFPAAFVDKEMLSVQKKPYVSPACIAFQRTSVIALDSVYALGVYKCLQSFRSMDMIPSSKLNSFFAFLLLDGGLLLVDHVHFQYNGFLMGIWLLSFYAVLRDDPILVSILFSVLLNLKHIFLYVAPAYFFYLFFRYCFNSKMISLRRWDRVIDVDSLFRIGSTVVGVFALSFGPFVMLGCVGNVLARLFPFGRGLTHAYWAPNFWALYNTADRAAAYFATRVLKLNVPGASMTSGLVQEYSHAVLPSISPVTTFVLTMLATLPALLWLAKNPTKPQFLCSVTLCAFSSFLFGWHVHEKAIIMVTLPLTLIALSYPIFAPVSFLLYCTALLSLFPLFTGPFEGVLKLVLTIFSILLALCIHQIPGRPQLNLRIWEKIYLLGMAPVYLYYAVIHSGMLGLHDKLPFLPLLVISTYCSVGVMYCFIRLHVLMDEMYCSAVRVNEALADSRAGESSTESEQDWSGKESEELDSVDSGEDEQENEVEVEVSVPQVKERRINRRR